MKQLLTILLTIIGVASTWAAPDLTAGKRYHIVCQQFTQGCVTDGASAGQSTPVYYQTTANTNDETYWLFTRDDNGYYLIQNAKTLKYVTYDGVRDTYRRYVSMTQTPDNDNSLWSITMWSEGLYVIRNVAQPDQVWDVRTNSYMVGTYSRQNDISNIERFSFYDEAGTMVKEHIMDDTSIQNGLNDPLKRCTGDLNIDGHALSYVESLDLYLCSVPQEVFGTTYTATVNYTQQEGYGLLYIDNTGTPSGSQHRFTNVSAGKTYAFSITKPDGTTVKKNVAFTSLPVVKIYGTFNNDYSKGHIIVQETDQPITELMNMKAKWRGGITNGTGKNKRNYHVKLQDADGNKMERKFFGLRNDNSWILESCQVDMSRIRNRVLTDLWNDYSTPPYYIDLEPKAKTGTRGRFVELVLNDEYRGIYCMTENMDRKQLKLMKHDDVTGENHGMLWKSKDWSFAVMMGTRPNGNYYPRDYLTTPNEWSESWDQYYVKYPDIEDVPNTDWQPLYDAVHFTCYATDDEFKSRAAEVFDMPLLIDYYILMETILSTDNHGKNMFFAIYDKAQSQKVTFAVWDMDATTGQRWSDDYYHATFLGPEQDYAEFITNYEHGDYNLFKRLRDTNADNFNEKVRLRYRDLRANHLATESILQRFRTYLDEFKACGAAQREYDRWNGNSDISGLNLDFDTEMVYLTDWFTRRMNYLDTQRFDIASLPSDIQTPEHATSAQDIYNLSGQKVGTRLHIDRLPAGIYIIGGKKVVVK